jgi:hypothetical protein
VFNKDSSIEALIRAATEKVTPVIKRIFSRENFAMPSQLENICTFLKGTFSESRSAIGIGCTYIFMKNRESDEPLMASLKSGAISASKTNVKFSGRPFALLSNNDYRHVSASDRYMFCVAAISSCLNLFLLRSVTLRHPIFQHLDSAQQKASRRTIAKIQKYHPYAALLRKLAAENTKKLTEKDFKKRQRVSSGVKFTAKFAASLVKEARKIGTSEAIRQFCTQRTETTICVTGNNAELLVTAINDEIPLMLRATLCRLDKVTDNAASVRRQFDCKLRLWANMAESLQDASKHHCKGLLWSRKCSAMRFIAGQLELLIRGETALIKAKEIRQMDEIGRSCCFIPRNALPPEFVNYVLEKTGQTPLLEKQSAKKSTSVASAESVAGPTMPRPKDAEGFSAPALYLPPKQIGKCNAQPNSRKRKQPEPENQISENIWANGRLRSRRTA